MDEERKSEEKVIAERKEKLGKIFKKPWMWTILILIIAVILGVYVRTLPMADHGGHPGLWDITTNTWTLGPDLDPWLFLRDAKTIVEKGSLPKVDMMRNVPLGFENSYEVPLLPYMIAGTYYFLNLFTTVNIEYAGVVFPVIMFAFTILSFFFFVREIFVRKTKESEIKANIIALISTFFMILIPEFLSRTVAGIPEKESAGFFFMFLAFYLFLKAWKTQKIKGAVLYGVLAGAATALMGLVWGGVTYIFVPIAFAVLMGFVFGKVGKKEAIAYSSWMIVSFLMLTVFTNKYSVLGAITSISTGSSALVLFIILFDMLIWKTKIGKIKILSEAKIPKAILSLIIAFVVLLLGALIFLGPTFVIDKIKAIHELIFQPVTGRWNTTVAENRQPYFTEWAQSFGPYFGSIPLVFWMFFLGSVLLFRKMLAHFKKKDAWILTFCYVFFFFGLVFSRYAPHPNLMDGDGFISKLFYYGAAIILIGVSAYYYREYHKKGEKSFETIDFEYFILFALFIITLMTARGAVRLIMVLAPIAPIFVGYLLTESSFSFPKVKDEMWKVVLGAFILIILAASIFSLYTFYNGVSAQSYSYVPSYYNQQWQKAMNWTRESTPENAVFAHWWDYGYWVQSIGNRATVSDGGNAIVYWNYLMGRLVLTGDNQKDSLNFLYNHNATYLLIDSSDIGKYGAFSSIGSDEKYDRYSWIGTLLLDDKQTQETNNQTLMVYPGGIATDEDLTITLDGKEVYLPGQKTGVGGIIVPLTKKENSTATVFGQPYAVMVYNGKQYKVELRYLSVNGKFLDFGSGITGCAYIFPAITPQGQGVTQNPIGAMMYLSPRLMRGYLAQKYILDDPFNKFPNFKVVHSEPNLIVQMLNDQGMNLPEFVYYQGVQGPIKIWSIKYNGDEKVNQAYLDKDYTKYLSWQL
ncbi:Oligosaccharyl transferase STT3 subunit [uncultured archaeon]|nr:Oligosaccharyl transferase STT3 subunit [uncultured archaeon]